MLSSKKKRQYNRVDRLLSPITALLLLLCASGEIVMPSLNLLERKMTNKIVCVSPTALANAAPVLLTCGGSSSSRSGSVGGVRSKRGNESRLKIISAVSGMQSREICPQFLVDQHVETSDSCDELLETTRLFKEKCDGKRNCTIDLSEPIPHNCANDLHSFTNITYRCTVGKLPRLPFYRHRPQGLKSTRRLPDALPFRLLGKPQSTRARD